MTPPSPSDPDGRVVWLRPRAGAVSPPPPPASPVEDLAKYEKSEPESPADYRHRMMVNALAALFVVLLCGAGLWLADTMAQMRKNQDCVLSGRRGCSPVDVPPSR